MVIKIQPEIFFPHQLDQTFSNWMGTGNQSVRMMLLFCYVVLSWRSFPSSFHLLNSSFSLFFPYGVNFLILWSPRIADHSLGIPDLEHWSQCQAGTHFKAFCIRTHWRTYEGVVAFVLWSVACLFKIFLYLVGYRIFQMMMNCVSFLVTKTTVTTMTTREFT